VIEFRSVTKRFARHGGLLRWMRGRTARWTTALDNLSFQCGRGEVLGVVGPNGAGKTTLTKLVANLILPDAGEVFLGGQRLSAGAHALRGKVGYVTCDERSFFWRLSGRENLQFFLALADRGSWAGALRLASYFELDAVLGQPFAVYSTGTRKRLALVRALMTQPDVLLCDEATNGLDPVSVLRLKALLRGEYGGTTVVWTTHRLEEFTSFCSQLLLLKEGSLLFQGPLAELKSRFQTRGARYVITVRGPPARVREVAARRLAAEAFSENGPCLTFTVERGGDDLYERLVPFLRETGAELVRFEEAEASLDAIYLSLVGKCELHCGDCFTASGETSGLRLRTG
jgi:ABC-2 type transport system ATP-binding protein